MKSNDAFDSVALQVLAKLDVVDASLIEGDPFVESREAHRRSVVAEVLRVQLNVAGDN